MTRFGAVVIGVILVACSSLYAQFDQTYVSAELGNDKRSCEFGHPCLTIDRAISQTNARGEVIILDSGPYEPFTVGKSINITAAPGVQPTITVGFINQGQGALITAGPQDDVTLRGLSITRAKTAGIRFISGRALLVESCTINDSSTAGIWVNVFRQRISGDEPRELHGVEQCRRCAGKRLKLRKRDDPSLSIRHHG